MSGTGKKWKNNSVFNSALMREKLSPCVSDTSTIIRMTKGHAGHCFEGLFEAVHIPRAVLAECQDSATRQTIARDVFKVIDVKNILPIPTLHKGELEALSLAIELGIETFLVDDNAGTKKAQDFSLKILTTYDLLILAKKKGLIPSVREALNTMLLNDEGVDPSDYERTVSGAGE